jgi:ectoine hydroxylase-related dioxygenase (phytanoyl-CoA dioxygenase family)
MVGAVPCEEFGLSPETVNFFMFQSMALHGAKRQKSPYRRGILNQQRAKGKTMAFMQLNDEQRRDFREKGFFVVRGIVPAETMAQVRNEILNFVENPGERSDVLSEERAVKQGEQREGIARYRKLERMGRYNEFIWNAYYSNPQVLEFVRQFIGDDILIKYDSVFLKPARKGGSTPWHQDIGLWRDDNVNAFNCWIAVESATKENGCLQLVPGTHREGLVEHVIYPDSLHEELPREVVAARLKQQEVFHAELQPGDAVMWQSYLWHYSPPNLSNHSRIGMGAVWTDFEYAQQSPNAKEYLWVMRDGQTLGFPPEKFEAPGERVPSYTPKLIETLSA